MKNKDLNWEDDNNVLFFFNDKSSIGVTIKDIRDFKKRINRSNRFVFIGEAYINLDNVAYIIEKDAKSEGGE